jgi:hypothetical protein
MHVKGRINGGMKKQNSKFHIPFYVRGGEFEIY